jgi:hypothetical protein
MQTITLASTAPSCRIWPSASAGSRAASLEVKPPRRFIHAEVPDAAGGARIKR